MPEITNITYTKEQIVAQLMRNDIWLTRGVVAIYKKQTDAEQATETTREDNGVGFNGADANILSSFAKQIMRWEKQPIHRSPLSPKQMMIARSKMKKYAGQLVKIANKEI